MSSLTNFLKLFKWDTKTDGSEKFNIDKALNGNWDKVDTYLENMEIGGRNYLLDSKKSVVNSSYLTASYNLAEKPIDEEEYTISLKGKLGTGKAKFGVYNTTSYVELANLKYYEDEDMYKSTFKWKSTQGSTTVDSSSIKIYSIPSSITVDSTIEWIKLEKGNKNTDWTPAPEDAENYTDTQITTTNNAIGLLSSLPTTDKTSLVNALKELYGNTFAKMKLNGNTYIEKTFDEVMNYNYSSIFTVHGADSVVKGAGFPSGAYSYGLLITLYSYANYAKTQIYIPDGPMKQGIYVRTRVGGNWLHLGGNVITGTEFATSEYIDSKQVCRKRVNIEALPNTTTKSVKHGLTNVTFIRLQGVATNDSGTTIPLPFASPSVEAIVSFSVNNTNVNVTTGMDRSNYSGYVDLYYTKNG